MNPPVMLGHNRIVNWRKYVSCCWIDSQINSCKDWTVTTHSISTLGAAIVEMNFNLNNANIKHIKEKSYEKLFKTQLNYWNLKLKHEIWWRRMRENLLQKTYYARQSDGWNDGEISKTIGKNNMKYIELFYY